MIWPRVIGQEWAKGVLLSAIRGGRLAHAYLFYGEEGVGKDALALELARALHCERREEEACGTCHSCVRITALQHPDVRFVVALPVGKGEESDDPPLSKLTDADMRLIQGEFKRKAEEPYYRISIPRAFAVKINSIREVRREAALSTSDGRRRVVIISHAELMKTEASNALLKTLEEPSGNTLLILTTAHREALLPTIQSRCQPVRFDLLKEEEIGTALRERKEVDPDRAVTVARIANGSYGMALELLEQDLDVQRENVLSFIRSVLGKQVVPFVESIEVMSAPRDREAVIRFLTLLLIWFRDAMVHAQGRAVINADQLTPIKNFVAKFPDANLVQVLADIEEAISLVKRNAYIMVVLLQLAVHLRANILGTRRTGT